MAFPSGTLNLLHASLVTKVEPLKIPVGLNLSLQENLPDGIEALAETPCLAIGEAVDGDAVATARQLAPVRTAEEAIDSCGNFLEISTKRDFRKHGPDVLPPFRT